jgi:hypothetical protein
VDAFDFKFKTSDSRIAARKVCKSCPWLVTVEASG